MTDSIRVLLVDDHAVVREGLRGFLHLQPGIEVVGEAANAADAVRIAAEVTPDVVLLDLVMPGGDGVSAIRGLREAVPDARILVLTSYADDAQVFAATAAGADGYLLKDVDPGELAEGVRAIHAGRPVLHPVVASRLMRRAEAPPGGQLSDRERQVLRLIVEGLANKQIAQRLGIGDKTVKSHVSHVLTKLGVGDRTQAAVLAIRNHLVDG